MLRIPAILPLLRGLPARQCLAARTSTSDSACGVVAQRTGPGSAGAVRAISASAFQYQLNAGMGRSAAAHPREGSRRHLQIPSVRQDPKQLTAIEMFRAAWGLTICKEPEIAAPTVLHLDGTKGVAAELTGLGNAGAIHGRDREIPSLREDPKQLTAIERFRAAWCRNPQGAGDSRAHSTAS